MPPIPPKPSTPPLVVTMGEPAGVGGDITLTAWVQRNSIDLPPFFLIDDPVRLTALAERLGLPVQIQSIAAPEEAISVFPDALPVMPQPLNVVSEPGRLDERNAECVIKALALSVELALSGAVSGIVTNPIHKQTLYASGFEHPGHTEFLGKAAKSTPVMMLSCPGLRVVPVTIHVPLRDVPDMLTCDLIVSRAKVLATALEEDFGLDHPRIAVAALNPHGGESGTIGSEEVDVIAPAIATLRGMGIDASGPYPADSLFHLEARAKYDAVLAMYHDQALIPLKTIDFNNGVNTTLGLPIVRTSPDHGTACDIAGSGKAHADSFIAALRQAAAIAAHMVLLS